MGRPRKKPEEKKLPGRPPADPNQPRKPIDPSKIGRPVKHAADDADQLAVALLEWADKPTSIIFLEFCCDNKLSDDDIGQLARDYPNFTRALELVKRKIATRREQWLHEGKLNPGVFHRYQSMYDKTLLQHERAEKAYDAELKKSIVNASSAPVTVQIVDYTKQ